VNIFKSFRIWLILYALLYGIAMLSLDGIRPYEQSPYHRYQAEALLHGKLCLADSMNALEPGLVWHDGRVQHVWGLGIGLWLLPFEAIWHLFSNQPFPDRIALGLAFALLAFYSATTGSRLIRQGQQIAGLAVIWMVGLCPALWTLARAGQLVFEETVLYSIILSLAILVALIRVTVFNSRTDYLFCCILGSFAVWIRPTHAVYGFGAILIASAVVWWHRRKLTEPLVGIFLWVASLAILAWTNTVRFGSSTEFGHHLTVTTGNMIYFTRFGNPCREASLFQAGKELFGVLFLANPQGSFAFSENIFPGQSAFTRWRKLDLSAFDLSYTVLILVGVMAAIFWLTRQHKQNSLWQEPRNALILGLLFWSGFSTVALGGFYLYYPTIASRYLLDFAPAFVGFGLLVWILTPLRWVKFVAPMLAMWIVYEITSAKVPVIERESQAPQRLTLTRTHGLPLNDFNGLYTTDNPPDKTRIFGNGYGWDANSSIAADVVSLAVDEPKFIELHLSARRRSNGVVAGNDVYQAQIDGLPLQLRETISEPDGWKIIFDVPQSIRERHGIEMLFLCFSEGYGALDRNSERFLYSVRWR
jgi:hypothetical protein